MKLLLIILLVGLSWCDDETGGEIETEIAETAGQLNRQSLTDLGINSSFSKIELRELNFTFIEPGVFEAYKDLTQLDLSRNLIKRLEANTFAGLERLKSLDLSGNQIESIDPLAFKGLKSLFGLDLSRNQLVQLDPSTFNGLTKLDFLVLSANKLKAIGPNTLDGLRSLKLLSLFSNPIETIDVDTVNSICLEEILMENKIKDRFYFVHNQRYCLKIKYLNVSSDELRAANFKKRTHDATTRTVVVDVDVTDAILELNGTANGTTTADDNETTPELEEEDEELKGEAESKNDLLSKILETVDEYNKESKDPVIISAELAKPKKAEITTPSSNNCKIDCIITTILKSLKEKFNVNIFNFNLN